MLEVAERILRMVRIFQPYFVAESNAAGSAFGNDEWSARIEKRQQAVKQRLRENAFFIRNSSEIRALMHPEEELYRLNEMLGARDSSQ